MIPGGGSAIVDAPLAPTPSSSLSRLGTLPLPHPAAFAAFQCQTRRWEPQMPSLSSLFPVLVPPRVKSDDTTTPPSNPPAPPGGLKGDALVGGTYFPFSVVSYKVTLPKPR